MESRTYIVNLSCIQDRGMDEAPAELVIQIIVHEVNSLTVKSVRAIDVDEDPPKA